MPQCMNFKNKDNPYGKGSLHAELLESSFRTRRRAAKINEGENSRLQLFTNILQRHKDSENGRNDRVMGRVRKTLEEMEAYKRLLRDSYKTENLMTLQWGFKPRWVQTPKSFHRYKIETRIYHCGFTKETLQPEVAEMIQMGKPEKRKYDFHQQLLQVARKRSDFQINRKLTDEGRYKERMALIREQARLLARRTTDKLLAADEHDGETTQTDINVH